MKKPSKLITKERAIELCNAHSKKQEILNRATGKEDNRSTWYSLEDLKLYIAYIEAQGIKKGFKVDGIRFYIGSYPENDSVSGKSNTTTVFLAPTGTKTGQGQPVTLTKNASSPDITEIKPFNFGHDGWPPQSVYPNN